MPIIMMVIGLLVVLMVATAVWAASERLVWNAVLTVLPPIFAEQARPVGTPAPRGWQPSYDPAARPTELQIVGAPPGGTASVTLRTTPGALCQVLYMTPAHDRFAGVGEWKRADGEGVVSWSWMIDPDSPRGEGVLSLACEGMAVQTEIPIQ